MWKEGSVSRPTTSTSWSFMDWIHGFFGHIAHKVFSLLFAFQLPHFFSGNSRRKINKFPHHSNSNQMLPFSPAGSSASQWLILSRLSFCLMQHETQPVNLEVCLNLILADIINPECWFFQWNIVMRQWCVCSLNTLSCDTHWAETRILLILFLHIDSCFWGNYLDSTYWLVVPCRINLHRW